jgi:hypothetical protein
MGSEGWLKEREQGPRNGLSGRQGAKVLVDDFKSMQKVLAAVSMLNLASSTTGEES